MWRNNSYIRHFCAPKLEVISFLNELQLIYLHTSIAIVSTELNYFNLKLIILPIIHVYQPLRSGMIWHKVNL